MTNGYFPLFSEMSREKLFQYSSDASKIIKRRMLNFSSQTIQKKNSSKILKQQKQKVSGIFFEKIGKFSGVFRIYNLRF